jgi:hypothetical protein
MNLFRLVRRVVSQGIVQEFVVWVGDPTEWTGRYERYDFFTPFEGGYQMDNFQTVQNGKWVISEVPAWLEPTKPEKSFWKFWEW